MIKKRLLPLILAFTSGSCMIAQTISEGFYRVQNRYTKRYVYVYDSYGTADYSTLSADMGAIVLQSDANLRFNDPASVIYVSGHGKYSNYNLYDLESQGTGVHKIINYYVTIVNSGTNKWSVYEPNHSMYLYDGVASTSIARSYMQTQKPQSANNEIGYWSIFPVKSETEEYLGITPHDNLKIGDKYYKPYVLGFAFDFASTGMKAYYVSEIKTDAVIISEVKGTVPAGTPVIVECSSTDCANNRVNVYATSPAKISDNKLSGNYFCYEGHATSTTGYKEYDAATMRLLAVVDGKLTYITDTNQEHHTALVFKNGNKQTTRYCLNANESYLTVPAGTAANLTVMTQEEYDASRAMTGDVNGDKTVDASDVQTLYQLIVKGATITDNAAADVNGDKIIDASDVQTLYQLIVKGKQ